MSLEDFLPEDHLARFIWETIMRMDLRNLLAAYSNGMGGQPAHDPKRLLAVILYGHATGTASSRGIEQACREEIGFRYVCGGLLPDHSTICRFRIRHEAEVANLFGQVLHLCAESGFIKLGVIALDGTKISANASLEANRTFKTLAEQLEKQTREIDKAEKKGMYQSHPRLFANMKDRLSRLDAAKMRLEKQKEASVEAQE